MRAPSRAAFVTTSRRWKIKPNSAMPRMISSRTGRTSANSTSWAPRSERHPRCTTLIEAIASPSCQSRSGPHTRDAALERRPG